MPISIPWVYGSSFSGQAQFTRKKGNNSKCEPFHEKFSGVAFGGLNKLELWGKENGPFNGWAVSQGNSPLNGAFQEPCRSFRE